MDQHVMIRTLVHDAAGIFWRQTLRVMLANSRRENKERAFFLRAIKSLSDNVGQSD